MQNLREEDEKNIQKIHQDGAGIDDYYLNEKVESVEAYDSLIIETYEKMENIRVQLIQMDTTIHSALEVLNGTLGYFIFFSEVLGACFLSCIFYFIFCKIYAHFFEQ